MIKIKEIEIDYDQDFYAQERDLRNRVLLRPFGLADSLWEMHDFESFHVIAFKDKKLLGCVLLRHIQKTNNAQLLQMAVESSLQGRGIGKMLVQHLLEIAKEKNIREVYCHSRANAISFYEKLGFKIYSDCFEEVGIEHVKMKWVDTSKD